MKKTLLAAALGFAASLFASPASACLNEVLKQDEAIKMIATAQEEVDRGELAAAREDARKAAAGRVGWDGTPDERLVDRAMRIRALADARDPNVSHDELWSDEDMIANIRRNRGGDPVLDAEYGELLARLPGREDQAHDILAPLAKRDLIGSPWALAALARVSKDPNESADARAACARVGGEGLCGERVAAQQKWYGPIAKPVQTIGAGAIAGGVGISLSIAAGLAFVIVRRRRRIASAFAT